MLMQERQMSVRQTSFGHWLIGHGDITVLLNAAVANGLVGIYGPMAYQIMGGQELPNTITRNILFGTLPQYKIPGNANNRCGHAEGIS